MLKLHKDSHVDHVPVHVVVAALEVFAHKDGFFVESFTLPEDIHPVMCSLHGPSVGEDEVAAEYAEWRTRKGRKYPSRMCNRPPKKTRVVTVIGGPHDGQPCVLFTIHGGPPAPKEVLDPTLVKDGPDKIVESVGFWSTHALSIDCGSTTIPNDAIPF